MWCIIKAFWLKYAGYIANEGIFILFAGKAKLLGDLRYFLLAI